MLIRVLLLVDVTRDRVRILDLLERQDLVIATAAAPDLWERLGQEGFDVLIMSRSELPDPPADVLDGLRNLPRAPEVIVLQDKDDPEDRAALLAAGCLGVISRDLPDKLLGSALLALIDRHDESLLDQMRAEEVKGKSLSDFSSLSPAISDLLALAERVAASDTSLLILGETGVGKEWLARAIHEEGPRRAFPFIALNCAAVPDTLLESELFGHEKGAFTGAHRARRGHFEMAHRGTLFLDEIADMAPHLQGKLLRVLQERQIRRLGSEKPLKVSVRIMAATNRNIEETIAAGELRTDLYYRLGVVTLTMPPLRDRREDIPTLAMTYLEDLSAQLARPISGITADAMDALVAYAWPGNVRELINVMERAVLLGTGSEIALSDLPTSIAASGRAASIDRRGDSQEGLWLPTRHWPDLSLAEAREQGVAAIERTYLAAVLERTHGRIGETAAHAGITPRFLYEKMKQLGLRKEDFKG